MAVGYREAIMKWACQLNDMSGKKFKSHSDWKSMVKIKKNGLDKVLSCEDELSTAI